MKHHVLNLVIMASLTMGCMVGCDLDLNTDALVTDDAVVDVVTTEDGGGKGGDGCLVDLDCEDYDPSTLDQCIDAVCVHEGVSCIEDSDCEDGIPYTHDFCDQGQCSEYWLECWWSQDCDDGIACTKDICSSGECDNSAKEGFCDDSDPCTLDSCNSEKGCKHVDICGEL